MMDYAKEYDRMVEQSNRQQEGIELLQSMLRGVSEDLATIERKLKEAVDFTKPNPEQNYIHKKINYGIGIYWDSPDEKAISLYCGISGEIAYGSIEDAENTLRRIQAKVPELAWKIFVLAELDTVSE